MAFSFTFGISRDCLDIRVGRFDLFASARAHPLPAMGSPARARARASSTFPAGQLPMALNPSGRVEGLHGRVIIWVYLKRTYLASVR